MRDPKKLEQLVFNALDCNLISEFKDGFYFNGDHNWKDIEPNIKRPDVIYFEDCGDKCVSVSPHDVKVTTNAVKLGQVSPLTLKSLYNNDEFRGCLKYNLKLRGFSGYDLNFKEGSFIIPSDGISAECYTDGLVRLVNCMHDDGAVRNKKMKINKLIENIGYFPFNVFLVEDQETIVLNDIIQYGDLGTKEYSIDTDVSSSVTYFDSGSDILRVIVTPVVEFKDL